MPWLTYIKIAAVALVLAGAFYMGKVWEQTTWQKKELAYLAQIEVQKKLSDKVAYDYETERDKRAIAQREVIREVYTEVARTDYSCQLPADGLRIINKAIAAANASKPGDAMPTNPPVKR